MIVRNNRKGFTLLELVFVIILVSVLAAAAVARYISLAKDAERQSSRTRSAISAKPSAFILQNNWQAIRPSPLRILSLD